MQEVVKDHNRYLHVSQHFFMLVFEEKKKRQGEITKTEPEALSSSLLSAWWVLPLFVGPTCKMTFRLFLRALGYQE